MNLNELNPVLMSIVNAVLVVLAPALAVALLNLIVGYSRKVWAEFKAAQPSLADQLARYAKIAVEAAEQAGAAEVIKNKRNYAIMTTAKWLEQVGLVGVDVNLIEAEVERQVRAMKMQG